MWRSATLARGCLRDSRQPFLVQEGPHLVESSGHLMNKRKRKFTFGSLHPFVYLAVTILLIRAGDAWGQTAGKDAERVHCATLAQSSQMPRDIGATEIKDARRRLAELGYWVKAEGGRDEASLRHALIAFQKVEGRPRTGVLLILLAITFVCINSCLGRSPTTCSRMWDDLYFGGNRISGVFDTPRDLQYDLIASIVGAALTYAVMKGIELAGLRESSGKPASSGMQLKGYST